MKRICSVIITIAIFLFNSPMSSAAIHNDANMIYESFVNVADICIDNDAEVQNNNHLGNDYMSSAEGTRIRNGWWWGSSTVSVFYGPGITSSMQAKIEAALDTWGYVNLYNYTVDFTFTEVESISDADIRFTCSNLQSEVYGTTTPYDVSGHPEGDGDCVRGEINYVTVIFSYPSGSEYSFNNTSETGKINFESVALHEIGHALGIAHCHTTCTSSCTTNVMSSFITTGQVRRSLQEYDKASLTSLYCIYQPFS